MANNLLILFNLDADTMAFASLLVSIVGAVAAIVAAFYANIAPFYAKRAATQRDLIRVEPNDQYVEHFNNKILCIDTPISPQEKQEDSQAQAQQGTSQPQAERKISPTQQEDSQVQAPREASPAQLERKDQQEAPQVQEKRETTPA